MSRAAAANKKIFFIGFYGVNRVNGFNGNDESYGNYGSYGAALIRNPLLSQEAAAVLCDEDVVLDADAAEVLVGLEEVEVDELGTMAC
jgi:hypothetical protein